MRLPQAFSVPDQELWQKGYPAEARRSLLKAALTLDNALDIVKPFLDPLLGGTAHGVWVPEEHQWR